MTDRPRTQTHKPIEPLPLQLARVADAVRLLTYQLAHTANDTRLELAARKAATDLVAYLVEIARKSPQARFFGAVDEITPPTTRARVCEPFRGLIAQISDQPHQRKTPGTCRDAATYAIVHDLRMTGHTPTRRPSGARPE